MLDEQAAGSELAALKQRARAAEQETAALQQGKLEAEAASAAARKAQKAGASCPSGPKRRRERQMCSRKCVRSTGQVLELVVQSCSWLHIGELCC